MKLYKNLVDAVARIVQEILANKRHADKAIEYQFKKNPQWGSRDRRFIAEGVYDIVRNFRLYATLAQSETNFWFITAVWLVIKHNNLPDWPEFKHVSPGTLLSEQERLKTYPAIFQSYPDWMWEKASQELGSAAWENEAVAMNVPAPVFLRVNTLKTSLQKLKTELAAEKIETTPVEGCDDALKLNKRENIFRNRLFKEGAFEVQDAGSQLISRFLNPRSGETVIDACAGAGGKSLHMAALMQNKGRIVSMDVEGWKLEELKTRARRAGAFNIETRLIENEGTISGFSGRADKLLLDVPCSGLGVIRRNPDAKWKLTAEGIEATRNTQRTILSSYAKMLKPGGTLVYSTCSILPSENRAQVDAFLAAEKNFELLDEKTLLPSQTGFDGFYMAALKKN